LRERENYGRLIFLYGVRTNAELCFADEAEAMRRSGVEIVVTVTEPETPTNERRYVQHLLDRFLPQMPLPTALICGSPAMMEDTRARLLAHAVAPEAILTNY
jgi:NAD(P)H-flavin reductase